jgi:hypothetical protein
MLHNKRGQAIPGTDVPHFFSLSPKVGQPRHEYCAFSREEIDNGAPGWIHTLWRHGPFCGYACGLLFLFINYTIISIR